MRRTPWRILNGLLANSCGARGDDGDYQDREHNNYGRKDPRTFLGAVLTGGGHKRRFLAIANDDDGVVHSVRSLEAGDLAVELTR